MDPIPLSETYEMVTDHRTVWINDKKQGHCVARHGLVASEFFGPDTPLDLKVFKLIEPPSWSAFRALVKDGLGVELPKLQPGHEELKEGELAWPVSAGIWMGFIDETGWFPMQVKPLEDDMPSAEQLRLEKESPETAPKRETLIYLAQFPESATKWPYTFPGCHPAKRWRLPDEEERFKAERFYGLNKTPF
jgi:hypothetical protein